MFRIILFLIVLFPFVALSQDPNPAETNDQPDNVMPIENSEIISLLRDMASILDYYSREQAKEGYPDESQITAARDLLAQRRMAVGTEDMAKYAGYGILLTLIAIGLLFGTLHYTGKAATHTGDTLGVAKNTIEVAKDTTKKELRAYMTIGNAIREELASGDYEIRIEWVNTGNTPAINVKMGAIWLVTDIPDLTVAVNELRKDDIVVNCGLDIGSSAPIGTDTGRELTKQEHKAIFQGRNRLLVHTQVAYSDIDGTRYIGELIAKIRIVNRGVVNTGHPNYVPIVRPISPYIPEREINKDESEDPENEPA